MNPLHCVQRWLPPLPEVPGHRITLWPPAHLAGNVPPLQALVSFWQAHGIKDVIAAMARVIKPAVNGAKP